MFNKYLYLSTWLNVQNTFTFFAMCTNVLYLYLGYLTVKKSFSINNDKKCFTTSNILNIDNTLIFIPQLNNIEYIL